MTEEIIIDGVDVAGCNFRLERDNKQKCECCHATGFGVICDCEAWHNCYYKQLKRLEQENKELKEQAQLDGECIDKLIEARDMYAKALEEIRNYCDRIEQGSVIGTQDCLINSIKNIVNYTINEVLGND